MPAIGVAQAPRAVIVFGEEERGVSALNGVLEKELVHRFQKPLRMFQSGGALAAQIRLQIGHQQSRGDSFARDVADRVVFMDQGEIVEINAPEEFFAAPRHERTKAFLSQILR